MKRETANEMIEHFKIKKFKKERELERFASIETSQKFTDQDKSKLIYDAKKYISFYENEILDLEFRAD